MIEGTAMPGKRKTAFRVERRYRFWGATGVIAGAAQ
jgi:hypothetical protein